MSTPLVSVQLNAAIISRVAFDYPEMRLLNGHDVSDLQILIRDHVTTEFFASLKLQTVGDKRQLWIRFVGELDEVEGVFVGSSFVSGFDLLDALLMTLVENRKILLRITVCSSELEVLYAFGVKLHLEINCRSISERKSNRLAPFDRMTQALVVLHQRVKEAPVNVRLVAFSASGFRLLARLL